MKNKILFCFVFMSSFSAFSQVNDAFVSKATLESTTLDVKVWNTGKVISTPIDGSIYLFSNWTGLYKIITKSGESHAVTNLNYNLKTKKIESFRSKDSVFQYDLKQFDYVYNFNKKYKVVDSNELSGMLLEVSSGPKINLYKEMYIVTQRGAFNPLSHTNISNDSYVQMSSYYFFVNGKYEKIKLNKKVVAEYTKDKNDMIRDFVKKNNLNYSSEEDVSRILRYYNSI